jgi:hypothetical protein
VRYGKIVINFSYPKMIQNFSKKCSAEWHLKKSFNWPITYSSNFNQHLILKIALSIKVFSQTLPSTRSSCGAAHAKHSFNLRKIQLLTLTLRYCKLPLKNFCYRCL